MFYDDDGNFKFKEFLMWSEHDQPFRVGDETP